jgi:NAD-reducing hydrogenase large subunit
LHAADGVSTPRAAAELEKFRETAGLEMKGGSLLYHYARLLELLYALERAEEILQADGICGREIRVTANPSREEGVGVVEAPRGTLIHHYKVDRHGAVREVNLIVATGHNNMAMNRSVLEVARAYIHNGDVKEGILNRVEGAIRCYDPCLSCSTHALGQMPLRIMIYGSGGELEHDLRKDK